VQYVPQLAETICALVYRIARHLLHLGFSRVPRYAGDGERDGCVWQNTEINGSPNE
jgi:hypothetical protein